MKLNINAGLVAAVSVFRAKDDIRYYLGGVYVEPLDAGVMIVATQGHAMCMWRDAEGFAERLFAVLMPMREDGKIEDIPKFAIDFKASKHPEQSK